MKRLALALALVALPTLAAASEAVDAPPHHVTWVCIAGGVLPTRPSPAIYGVGATRGDAEAVAMHRCKDAGWKSCKIYSCRPRYFWADDGDEG